MVHSAKNKLRADDRTVVHMLPRSVGMEWKSYVAQISAAVPHAAAHSLGTVSTLPAARALDNWHRKKSLDAFGQKDGVRFFLPVKIDEELWKPLPANSIHTGLFERLILPRIGGIRPWAAARRPPTIQTLKRQAAFHPPPARERPGEWQIVCK
jgi:hypothetical protein